MKAMMEWKSNVHFPLSLSLTLIIFILRSTWKRFDFEFNWLAVKVDMTLPLFFVPPDVEIVADLLTQGHDQGHHRAGHRSGPAVSDSQQRLHT